MPNILEAFEKAYKLNPDLELHVAPGIKEKKPFLKGYYSGDSKLNVISIIIRLFSKNEDKRELIQKINDLDVIYLSWDDRDNLTEILQYIAENNLSEISDTPIKSTQ